MIVKELIEARWKIVLGLVIPLVALLTLVMTAPNDIDKASLASALRTTLAARTSKPVPFYDAWVWEQTFVLSDQLLLVVLAVALGVGLIAGEVSRGTILFLLSKPINRDRALLIKYGVSAALLLGMVCLMGIVTLVIPALRGHPQHLGGVLLSIVLLWLETLFVLGVALVYSVLFKDVLWPMVLAVLTVAVAYGLPSYVILLSQLPERLRGVHVGVNGRGTAWSLPTYWANLDAFAGNSFPTQSLFISLIAAAIPLVIAIALFRRRAY